MVASSIHPDDHTTGSRTRYILHDPMYSVIAVVLHNDEGTTSRGVPRQWLRKVNAAMKARELEAARRCVDRGRPFGGEVWVKKTSARLDLEHTLRSPGRPRKEAVA